MSDWEWCSGKCSERTQKRTLHDVKLQDGWIVYTCQECRNEHRYRPTEQKANDEQ